jgi:hypothetical protein
MSVNSCQAILLEARVFRGLASTVPLSAELGKNEKGLPSNPKKQSPSKSKVLMVVVRDRGYKVNQSVSFPSMKMNSLAR